MDRPFPAYEGDEPFVFVCYSHDDADLVYPEIRHLHERGFRIWYDEGVFPGSEWTESIALHIERCSAFLCFITDNSVASEHCRREINFALDQPCPILSIHLLPTDLPPALKLVLNHRQAILRYAESSGSYRRKVAAALDDAVRSEDRDPISPVRDPSAPRNLTTRWVQVSLAILLAVAIGFGVLSTSRNGSETRPMTTDRIVLSIPPPIPLSDMDPAGQQPAVIAQDLISALLKGSPFQVVTPDGTGNHAQSDYQLITRIAGEDSTNDLRLSVQLVSMQGLRRLVWAEDVAFGRTGNSARFEKSDYVANVIREVIYTDQVVARIPFQDEQARRLLINAIVASARADFSGEPGDFGSVVHLFEQSAAREPKPITYGWLAISYANAGWGEWYRTRAELEVRSRKANQAAHKAIELARGAPPLAGAFAELSAAIVAYQLDQDMDRALDHLSQSAAFGQVGSVLEYHRGNVRFYQGSFREAADHYRAALEAGSDTRDTGMTLSYLAHALGYLGQHREALDTLQRLRHHVASAESPLPWLEIRTLVRLDRLQDARNLLSATLARLHQAPPYETVSTFALFDDLTSEANAMLAELDTRWESGTRFPCMDAVFASFYLGKTGSGFRWLERAIDQREVDPRIYAREFADQHTDVRWHEAMMRIEAEYVIRPKP